MFSSDVSLKEKIGYGLGDMSSSMFWKLFSMYLMFFYTDVFGIESQVAAFMFLITRAWDTLFDPLVGIIADRTHTRYGKFRPYILYVAIPFGVLGILTFTTPDFTHAGKVIYAYFTYSAMMMIYSLINVPYASLLGVISPHPKVRNALASFRMAFAFLGSILVLALIEPLVKKFSYLGTTINLQQGWQLGVAVIAVICILLFWCCFALTKERVKPIRKKNPNGLKQDVTDLLINRPWWILLLAGMFTLIFNSIRDGSTVYFFKYYIQNETNAGIFGYQISYSTLFLIIGQAANVVGVVLATPVANTIGKKKTFLAAMCMASLLSFGFYFLEKENLQLMFVFQFLISACAGIIFPLMWSMYADISDYSELKTERNATGLIFSSSSMSQKFGWAIGGAFTGWLLSIFHFKANVEQSDVATTGIRLMVSIFPAIGALLSFTCMLFYPLSENKVNDITKQLEEKRKQLE